MSLSDADSFSTSNAPSPSSFYRQHHEVEAPLIDERHFRPHYRVKTQLDRLALDGLIPGAAYRIATWFRSCYERGYGSELHSTLPRLGMPGLAPHGRGREDPSARRAAAREYLVHVEKTLGATVYKIVLAVVVDDLSWAKLGRQCRCTPKTAKTWAIEAIKVLATV